MEFSTYNESSLHHTLKLLYAETYSGQTEVPLNGHIYDIATSQNQVIEIQTKNLSALAPKVKDTIEHGINIKIVHPIPITTTIELYNEENQLIGRRKSPIKGCVYDIFRQLTKLYPYLLDKHFSLEIVEINMVDRRLQTSEPVQTKNKKRRFKKNWVKTDKKLVEILDTLILSKKEDYIKLLPISLPEEFSSKELKESLKEEHLAPAKIYNNPNLILWVLSRMDLIKETKTLKRYHYYKIN